MSEVQLNQVTSGRDKGEMEELKVRNLLGIRGCRLALLPSVPILSKVIPLTDSNFALPKTKLLP